MRVVKLFPCLNQLLWRQKDNFHAVYVELAEIVFTMLVIQIQTIIKRKKTNIGANASALTVIKFLGYFKKMLIKSFNARFARQDRGALWLVEQRKIKARS